MGSNRFAGLKEITKPHGGVGLADESVEKPAPNAKLSESAVAAPILLQPVSGMIYVPRRKIHRDSNQSRRYFDPNELQKMAESIRKVGIIDPYSVRRRPGTVDEYDLLAGERRDRAAEIAGLDTVPVRIFDVDDSTAEDIKDISNLQRVDLNAWEESWALMRMLMRNLKKSQSDVEKLLHQMSNQQREITQKKVPPDEWQIVEDVFAITGRITWDTFRKTRIKLLKLPEKVETILREGKLDPTKVDEILKIKDLAAQEQLLQEAIQKNLPFLQIKDKVRDYKRSQSASESTAPSSVVDAKRQFQDISTRLKKHKLWDNPKVIATLKQFDDLLSSLEKE